MKENNNTKSVENSNRTFDLQERFIDYAVSIETAKKNTDR